MSRPDDISEELWAEADRIWITSDAGPVELIARTLIAERALDKYTDATIQAGVNALAKDLVAKSKNLVALLDDAEVNHGGLWSGKTMRARDDLRQELARWR